MFACHFLQSEDLEQICLGRSLVSMLQTWFREQFPITFMGVFQRAALFCVISTDRNAKLSKICQHFLVVWSEYMIYKLFYLHSEMVRCLLPSWPKVGGRRKRNDSSALQLLYTQHDPYTESSTRQCHVCHPWTWDLEGWKSTTASSSR